MPIGSVSISKKRRIIMNTKNLLVGIGLCLLSACTEVDNKLEVDKALGMNCVSPGTSYFGGYAWKRAGGGLHYDAS